MTVHGIDAIKNGAIDPRRTVEARAILDDFSFCYNVQDQGD